MDEVRSRETRARAELALVRLLHELRDESVQLVVLGGLVPEILTHEDSSIPTHLGTTDVDILLITHLDPEADLGSVEQALQYMSFKPDPTEDGWRWSGPVDNATVKLEFLCDLSDQREREIIRPRGCTELAAANLRGTGYVASDFALKKLVGELADGRQVEVDAHSALLRADAVDVIQRFFLALGM
jgi:hypothetical protein